ncbi:MAG: DUF885 family protein [Alphaproteobacteria bacterium]|nr:DUF885 family protein [Alphaproteobacteria bacterium]
MMRKKILNFFVFTMLLNVSLYHVNAQTTQLLQQTSEVNNLMLPYEADKGNIWRFYSTLTEGRSRANKYTDPYHSPLRRQRLLLLIDDYLNKLESFDYNSLSLDGKVDYILFKRNLLFEKNELLDDIKLASSYDGYFEVRDSILNLWTLRQRGYKPNASNVAKNLMILKTKLENTAVPKTLSASEKKWFIGEWKMTENALQNYVQFYFNYDPEFTWWVKNPYDSLMAQFKKTNTAIAKIEVEQIKTTKPNKYGIKGNPIGADNLNELLKQEWLAYTPEELILIAENEMTWCLKEVKKAATSMGYQDNWKQALEKVKQTSPKPGDQPALVYKIYQESINFIKNNNLITIPPLAEETWQMNMLTPAQQKFAPFFLGGETLLIAYPTADMTEEDKLMSIRSNNPHFSKAVIHHELIAGHHLQGYMNNRYKVYRNFETPFWHEGNALYWEFLLYDKGFAKTPEDKIGMLFWRMHRSARVIFSLNFHLGKWSADECIQYLIDTVGHEPFSAESEVRRSFESNYGPLYQIAYLIGGLQFWALKNDVVDTQKLYTLKDFNDAIVQQNSMPIEVLRYIITKTAPPENAEPVWRFYKYIK